MRDRVKTYDCSECGKVASVERNDNGVLVCSYCGREIIED